MSRIPKCKVERTKVKVVFRLQFHATQIPQSGWDKLFLSFIPVDTGKATAKTNKSNVRNGSCKWSDPIYETTRLLQDPRTKKYDEKLYKLVVAMGSSRSSLLGEVIINLADFADASKPFSIALPLHSFGTILHVTVQLLTSKTGFREFEQQRELSMKGFQAISGQRIHDPAETAAASSAMASEQMDEVNTKVIFKEDSSELHSLEGMGKSNEDYADLAAGIDGSSNTSGSLCAEKNDFSCAHEVDSLRSTISGEVGVLPVVQSPRTVKGDQTRLLTQGSNEWTHGWSSDYSADNDLAIAYEENNRLRVRLEVVESAFLQLKTEAKSLQNLTIELGAETHSLAEQLVMELASGEKLSTEVALLKSDCSKFKKDLEKLKSSTAMQCIPGRTSFQVRMKNQLADGLSTDKNNFSHDLQNKWLQDLLLIEDKLHEILNKACLAHHGSDLNFLQSDLKSLDTALLNLKEGITWGTSSGLVEASQLKAIQLPRVVPPEDFNHQPWLEGSYIDHHNAAGIMQCFTNTQEPKKNVDVPFLVEEQMCELLRKLEESKTEKVNLVKKMDQMECYYEAFIQELEDNRHQTANEVENLRIEHSSCLYTVSSLESQVEKLQQDMKEQFIRFASDRHELDSVNKDLEKRAVASEMALKRVQWNYAIAVDRLQKDLELLSFQVLSMYETNEHLARQALTDVSQLSCPQYSEEVSEQQYRSGIGRIDSESVCMKTDHGMSRMANGVSDRIACRKLHNSDSIGESESFLQKGLPINVELQNKDIRRTHVNGVLIHDTDLTASQHKTIQTKVPLHQNGPSPVTKKNQSQNQCDESDSLLLADKVGLQDMTSALHMLKELKPNTKAELLEMHTLNMHWEVFTEVLQETLRDVNDGVRHMKNEMVELAKQLEDSSVEKESLMLKLNSTLEEARLLREDKNKIHSDYDDLKMKNHVLKAKVCDVSDENTSLTQKVAEYIMECGVYESKYKNCLEDKNQLENMLKTESLQRTCLQSEISSTVEGFKALKEEFNKQSSAKSDLQRTVCELQEKLRLLYSSMVSWQEEIDGSTTTDVMFLDSEGASNSPMAILLHLEHFQLEAYKKILQLRQEKQETEEQRHATDCSLKEAEAQILHMLQKFECEREEIRRKLDRSNALLEKLQLELEDVTGKLKISLDVTEKNKLENRELSSKLTILEIEIQQVLVENRDLSQEILVYKSVNEELEKSKTSLLDCMQENRDLKVSVESGRGAFSQMEDELSRLKETLRSSHDKVQLEGRLRKELEATVEDLTVQLKQKFQQLLSSDEQKAEMVLLRKKVVDLETEIHFVLLNTEESQRKHDEETSSLHLRLTDLENELVATLEHLLNKDMKFTYMICQSQSRIQELVEQNKGLQGDLKELNLKNIDITTSLKAREARLLDENARLSTAFQLLKTECELVYCEKEELIAQINEKNDMLTDVEALKTRSAVVEAGHSQEKLQFEIEACCLRNMLMSLEKEVDNLRSSRDELETTVIILRSKFDEQKNNISLLEDCNHELKKLREQYNELSFNLSEQILKTEEFKNLSTHLRELKDKAEAECLQARQRREADGSSLAVQESLRMVFIKEQCESKLQEMRDQLCASKKYGEEMLLKLQNALDEVESGKKNEAVLLKQNEEFSSKISYLETELQTSLSNRRELEKACDRMKAELECTTLTLDCCKEEKLNLEASWHECNEERTRVRVELDLVKRLLENMASSTSDKEAQKKHELRNQSITSIGELLEDDSSQLSIVHQETHNERGACSGEGNMETVGDDQVNIVENNKLLDMSCLLNPRREMQDLQPSCSHGSLHLTLQPKLPALQDGLVTRSTSEKEIFLKNDVEQIADINQHFKEQHKLMGSMDLLQKELERLKNDNLSSLLPLEGHHLDPTLQHLQSGFSQLDTANEHLGSISPLFKEFPGSGNALERVLALELELAEALQEKKSSEMHFQSSFLKHHKDEEAVFRSFKDINELIKDMLESKRRYGAVETELKEMQDRYSQLSLKFAEVEGERQQLLMTLKSRTPKKSETKPQIPHSRSIG